MTETKEDFVRQQNAKDPGIPSLRFLGGSPANQPSRIKQFDDVVVEREMPPPAPSGITYLGTPSPADSTLEEGCRTVRR